MTKEQLIALCKRLQKENKILRNELDRLSDNYSELEERFLDATTKGGDYL